MSKNKSNKQIRRTTDQAYESILSLLDSPKLKPGEYLPSERSLSIELNTSRPTIRKALQQLEHEGFLMCKPGIGYRILPKEKKATKENLHNQKLIGLIWSFAKNNLQFSLIHLLEEEFSRRGYSIMLGFNKLDVEKESERIKRYVEAGVQGLIIMPSVGEGDTSYITTLIKRNFPITFLGQPRNWAIGEKLSKQVNIVGQDNYRGIEKLIDHLCDLGHKDIGFVGNKIFSFPTLREKAFRQEMQEKGLTLVEDWMFKVASGEEGAAITLAKELKKKCFSKSKRKPTAIVCITEEIAKETKKAILSLNLEIPGDISIVTFASATRSEISDDSQGEFTHVKITEEEFARETVDSILSQINGSNAIRRILLEPILKDPFVSAKSNSKIKELKSN